MPAKLESPRHRAAPPAADTLAGAGQLRPCRAQRPAVRQDRCRAMPMRSRGQPATGQRPRAWPHLLVAAAGVAALLLVAPYPAPAQTAEPAAAQPAATAAISRQAPQALAPPGSLQDVGLLAARVAGFARARPIIDPRLVVPRCPAPALSWARADVVRADCADPAWTLYIPVAGTGLARLSSRLVEKPIIRRGDRVVVESSGPGFAISMEMEALRDADGSRIALKSPGGRQLVGRIEADGRVVLAR